MGNEITASIAIPAVALLNALRFPLSILPQSIKSVSETFVACKRLQNLLELPEIIESGRFVEGWR